MQKNNKSKIDKLKALDKSLEASKKVQAKTDDVQYRSPLAEDDQHKQHIYSHNIDHIIKLNEELTAENAGLLTDLEELTSKYKQLDLGCTELIQDLNIYKAKNMRKLEELTSIKSKWWYKLMTWEW